MWSAFILFSGCSSTSLLPLPVPVPLMDMAESSAASIPVALSVFLDKDAFSVPVSSLTAFPNMALVFAINGSTYTSSLHVLAANLSRSFFSRSSLSFLILNAFFFSLAFLSASPIKEASNKLISLPFFFFFFLAAAPPPLVLPAPLTLSLIPNSSSAKSAAFSARFLAASSALSADDSAFCARLTLDPFCHWASSTADWARDATASLAALLLALSSIPLAFLALIPFGFAILVWID
mmetsp:Transcript_19299/g.29234  ORF Transcript_19299/g.29234 Transcript_19299/m.29234 type:complete len:236 (+) Transcript_19299:409-1116(+)